VKILSGENLPPDRDVNTELPEGDTIVTFGAVAVATEMMKRETNRNIRVLRCADW
jgi:hypothetical protein